MTYITHATYITCMTYIIYITHITYITYVVKLIFKAYKKTNKIFFIIFFLYKKMSTKCYQKTKNDYKKMHLKDIKIFLKKKKKKSVNLIVNAIKIFLTLFEYRKNYFLTQNN